MKVRSKGKIPFLNGGKTIPQLTYVVAHQGLLCGFVSPHQPFGEAAIHYSRRLAKRGEFQIWLQGHWERFGQGFKNYQPLMTVKV